MTRLRLHVLDLGRLRLASRVLVGEGPSLFADEVEVPVSAYCIEHPEGRVLFDTGCHPAAMGPEGRWSAAFQRDYQHLGGTACTLPNRLAELGLGPDDFRHVVLSHLHSDHAGCAEFFRRSAIIVHADELAAAQAAYRRKEDDAYCWRDIDSWTKVDLHWQAVGAAEGDRDIHGGIRLLNFGPGHAFGMLGLRLDLPESGRIILVSDALYCAENFATDPVLPGWMEDRTGYLGTIARIRAISAGAAVWFGHDPRQFATLRTSAQGCYE